MLTVLKDLAFPITSNQFNQLMENLVQLNCLDAGIAEPMQRALGLHLHCWDLFVKSNKRINYLGSDGHQRLVNDAMIFCGTGNPVATRHGDLSAAHLALDFSDTSQRLKDFGLQPLPTTASQLLDGCRDLYGLSIMDEKRVGLLMDMLGKKPCV